MVIAGQSQHQGHLHQLRGLQQKSAYGQPAPRPHADGPGEKNRHQQQEGKGVEQIGIAAIEFFAPNQTHHKHYDQARHKTDHVPPEEVYVLRAADGGIEDDETDGGQNHQQQKQAPGKTAQTLPKRQGRLAAKTQKAGFIR